MFKHNIREYKYLNLNKWEKYQGKGIKVATIEKLNKNDVLPFKVYGSNEGSTHAKVTTITCLMTAPEIEFYSFDDNAYTVIEKCIENDIDFLFTSIGSSNELIQAVRDLRPDTILINSSGNTKSIGGNLVDSNIAINISGVTHTKRGIEFADSLFERHDKIDFATYGVIEYPDLPNDPRFYKTATGTSFSTPIFTALSARVQQLCLEKTGRKLSQKELYKFWKFHCDDEGLATNEVGNGVISLPDPETINFYDYFDKIVVMPKPEEEDEMDFKDVDKKDWFYKAIEFVSDNGIMNGYEDGTFKPNEPITRAEVATIIQRLSK